MARHERLGKALAGFQLRSGLRGAEDRNAAAAKLIDGAEHERNLGADDDQIRADLDGRFDDRVQAAQIAGDTGCFLRDAGVSGGAEDGLHPWRLLELPNQRVFAASAAKYEDFHGISNEKGYEVARV